MKDAQAVFQHADCPVLPPLSDPHFCLVTD